MSKLTFQRFYDKAVLEAAGEILEKSAIPNEIEDDSTWLAPVFNGESPRLQQFRLKVEETDFPKAEAALEDFYRNQLNNVESDYYLFDFSDQELIEVVAKPDEWGRLDYELAKKLLKDKGIAPNDILFESLKANRYEELAQPNRLPRYWLILGYIGGVLGGLLGIVVALVLIFSRQTLPNGKRVPTFSTQDRNHALVIALISFISGLLVRYFYWSVLLY
jgi:hypothetical protein